MSNPKRNDKLNRSPGGSTGSSNTSGSNSHTFSPAGLPTPGDHKPRDIQDAVIDLVKHMGLLYTEYKHIWVLRKVFHWVLTSPAGERIGSTTFKKISKDLSKGQPRRNKVSRSLVSKCFAKFLKDGILLQVVVRDYDHPQYIVFVPGMGACGVQWEIAPEVFALFMGFYQNEVTGLEQGSDRVVTGLEQGSDTNLEPVTCNQKPGTCGNPTPFITPVTISPVYHVLGYWGVIANIDSGMVGQIVAAWGIGENIAEWRNNRAAGWKDYQKVITTFKILYYVINGVSYVDSTEDLKSMTQVLKARSTVGSLIDAMIIYLHSDGYVKERGHPLFLMADDIMKYMGKEVPLAYGLKYGVRLYVKFPGEVYKECYLDHDHLPRNQESSKEAYENALEIPEGDTTTYGYAVKTLEVK